MKPGGKRQRTTTTSASTSSAHEPSHKRLKQESVSAAFKRSGNGSGIVQADFEQYMVEMIVEDMEPVAIVERSGFQKFCRNVAPNCTIPSRRTLSRRISDLYSKHVDRLVESFAQIKWMSATADIWSSHKRAFMGVTLHYVNTETLCMQSIFLVCRRFKNAHTGEAIARALRSILDEFGIRQKIQNIVTDNASNFGKAFSLQISDVYKTDECDADDNESVTGVDIAEVLDTADVDSEDGLVLPPHKRCGNHTLNLVCTTDAQKARSDANYKRTYDRAIAKVVALSNEVSRSPKSSDLVEEITGSTFLRPTVTRWCSEFYAIERVLEIGFDKVNECMTKLGHQTFSESDFVFLRAFMKAMKPIVNAMTLLQSEQYYIGHLIPTIIGIKKKLSAVTDRVTKPLISALIEGIDKRFGAVMTDEEYQVATALIPQFKLNFLDDENQKLELRHKLLTYIENVAQELHPPGFSHIIVIFSSRPCCLLRFVYCVNC